MIRIDLPDITTTDRLIEALYVAAGTREGSPQATQWRQLARAVETALDELPTRPPPAPKPEPPPRPVTPWTPAEQDAHWALLCEDVGTPDAQRPHLRLIAETDAA